MYRTSHTFCAYDKSQYSRIMFMGLSNYNYTQKKKTNLNLKCEIFFDFDVIYPGQIISGGVALSTIKESCPIEHVIIEVIGMAECQWKYDKHLVKPPRIYSKNTAFSGEEQIFFSRHTLAGGSDGIVNLNEIPSIFPFKTTLLGSLPATWKGQYGTVKYTAKVTIKQPKQPLETFTEEINVGARRDLKLEEYLFSEARQDVHHQFRYAIINLGNVQISVWLPLCGIGAGQSVPVLCTIVNESTVQFGGLVFVLTKLEVYRSNKPTRAVKTYRRDICRVPRMVDILHGTYDYYCMLDTDPDTEPTNQYSVCKTCQVIYEIWVSLQGSIPRYKGYGYPNIDTPGIPLIIGTEPLCEWNNQEVINDVMGAVYAAHPPIIMEPLPPDDDIEEMLNNADEELDPETERNLDRQLIDEPMFQIDDEASEDTVNISEQKDVKKNEQT